MSEDIQPVFDMAIPGPLVEMDWICPADAASWKNE